MILHSSIAIGEGCLIVKKLASAHRESVQNAPKSYASLVQMEQHVFTAGLSERNVAERQVL